MSCRWSRVAALLAVITVICFATTQATFLPAGVRYEEIECDIVVAGGSTAALAASLAAARTAPEKRICLLESTNWPGGQLTSSAVSAVDFGTHNVHPVNQPKDFAAMVASLPGNPGKCWVSHWCYEPADLLHKWIFPTINQTKNLRVFYNTVVKKAYTAKGPHGDEVKSILAVQRVPKEENEAWRNRLSEDLLDWYSLYESKTFNKKALHFSAPLFIEATEFGDLLVTADAPFAQGIEYPYEDDYTTLDCGQTHVFPLYMSIEKEPVKQPHFPPPPRGISYEIPSQFSWGRIWSYRRSIGLEGPENEARIGETSNQNWGPPPGNDYNLGYLYLPTQEVKAQAKNWHGGINMTSLADAELTAFGWYTYYSQQCNKTQKPEVCARVALAASVAGTDLGLSKVPYLRESRRSIGIHNFRLMYENMTSHVNPTGVVFADRVAIGEYFYADIHHMADGLCKYPAYLGDRSIKPYYVPFRALTNRDFGNMLVAGKTMAQTFKANAATRLHPVEWTTGLAAGVAAALMSTHSIPTTTQLYENNIKLLQETISTQAPLQWTL